MENVFYFMEKIIQTFWPTQYYKFEIKFYCLSRRRFPVGLENIEWNLLSLTDAYRDM